MKNGILFVYIISLGEDSFGTQKKELWAPDDKQLGDKEFFKDKPQVPNLFIEVYNLKTIK